MARIWNKPRITEQSSLRGRHKQSNTPLKKVFVGLSGGVDSAVSAALLSAEGGSSFEGKERYDVVGAFIKIWRPEFTECTWKEDRQDAMRVAAALGIPFREIDLSEKYKKEVVDSMVRDYARGITPNPDVLCNREIKFGRFFKWAREQGADFVATGHYARVVKNDGKFELHRGTDSVKDQSYFLHQIKGTDLAHILFPIGELEKSEVRRLAARFDLPVATRPDSQGLCFVGDISMTEFLARFIPLKSGPVLDEVSPRRIVGEHEGAALYTIGQRHGFKIFKSGEPYYVTRIDVAANTIFVSHRREDGAVRSACVGRMHWIDEKQKMPATAHAQCRYREESVPVTLAQESNTLRVTFQTPHIAAPGQSLVIYNRDRCLGGGAIQ
ncbi:MAG: tRNA 2-thiouridine(34) synthase MnmA [bacterium]|nr:tRNA 2-thiouridine(34) synthase MnmA [bacterium]